MARKEEPTQEPSHNTRTHKKGKKRKHEALEADPEDRYQHLSKQLEERLRTESQSGVAETGTEEVPKRKRKEKDGEKRAAKKAEKGEKARKNDVEGEEIEGRAIEKNHRDAEAHFERLTGKVAGNGNSLDLKRKPMQPAQKKRKGKEKDGEPQAKKTRRTHNDDVAEQEAADGATEENGKISDVLHGPSAAELAINDDSPKSIKKPPQPTRKKPKPKQSSKPAPDVPDSDPDDMESEDATKPNPSQSDSKSRFIVFVGNLPYDTTTESLESHFKAIHPDSVRHITQKPDSTASGGSKRTGKRKDDAKKSSRERSDGRSKGFAFLEFSSFDRMRTCLKLYHHSWFAADGSSASPSGASQERKSDSRNDIKKRLQSNARQISVELTAGGGGTKSKTRKEKLQKKNSRLHDQRVRDRQKRESEKVEKSKKTAEETEQRQEPAQQQKSYADVHPSRLGRVKGK